MSANLASETNFYIDFEPITFCQLIKKTLYQANWAAFESSSKSIIAVLLGINLIIINYTYFA